MSWHTLWFVIISAPPGNTLISVGEHRANSYMLLLSALSCSISSTNRDLMRQDKFKCIGNYMNRPTFKSQIPILTAPLTPSINIKESIWAKITSLRSQSTLLGFSRDSTAGPYQKMIFHRAWHTVPVEVHDVSPSPMEFCSSVCIKELWLSLSLI